MMKISSIFQTMISCK